MENPLTTSQQCFNQTNAEKGWLVDITEKDIHKQRKYKLSDVEGRLVVVVVVKGPGVGGLPIKNSH